jgi:hypothetical protein
MLTLSPPLVFFDLRFPQARSLSPATSQLSLPHFVRMFA